MGKILLFVVCNMMLFTACVKKNDVPGVASLNIFNGIVGTDTLVTDLSASTPLKWYRSANFVFYGRGGLNDPYATRENNQFNSYSGLQRFALLDYPDTLAHNKPVVDLMLDLPAGSNNSLFLTGSLQTPDTFFVRDQLPYHPASDSSAGLRVVNLIPGFTASVNLQGNAPGSELASLGYKAASTFKNYSVDGTGQLYVFEIRDAVTGSLLTTANVDMRNISWGDDQVNYYRFKNVSLIIYGEKGNTGAGAPAATIMNHY